MSVPYPPARNAATILQDEALLRDLKRDRAVTRHPVERFVVTGRLVLETAAHFGNGDADPLTDMPLLWDEVERLPLLTGASQAGALRNYLRERELGDWVVATDSAGRSTERERGLLAAALFGVTRLDNLDNEDEADGTENVKSFRAQSAVVVHDALGAVSEVERRDGVRIDPKTHTVEDDKKFDFDLLSAGSTFDLRFELLLGPTKFTTDIESFQAYRARLVQALATALDGLSNGEITLGMRKRRGFGRCRVDSWTVQRYDLLDRRGLRAWLAEGRSTIEGAPWATPASSRTAPRIVDAVGEPVSLLPDQRRRFHLHAEFTIEGSLLVRSSSPIDGPDIVHLHAPHRGGPVPIVAGTSWAGVLRSRATQIVKTIAKDREAQPFLDSVFGPGEIKARRHRSKGHEAVEASRLEVTESEVKGGHLLEQTRVKIDRFTGGASESALFTERPIFGQPATTLGPDGNPLTRVALDISLRLPPNRETSEESAEIGLLLLLLKDLWTGDLPVGGEIGVGRGRLLGFKAECRLGGQGWTFTENPAGQTLAVTGDKDVLERFVVSLKERLTHA